MGLSIDDVSPRFPTLTRPPLVAILEAMSAELEVSDPFKSLPTTFRLDERKISSMAEWNILRQKMHHLVRVAMAKGITVETWFEPETQESCLKFFREETES